VPEKRNQSIHHPIHALGIARATRGDIRIEKLEHRLTPKVPFPHRHDFVQIVFISKGSGWHQIDFEKHTVKAGQIFIIKPGAVHIWKMSPKTTGYIIEYTEESLAKEVLGNQTYLRQISLLPSLIQIHPKNRLFIESLLNSMIHEYEEKDFGFEVALQGLLTHFLIQLLRYFPQIYQQKRDETSTTQKFRVLIEEHFKNHHDVEYYAKTMGLNAKALTMRVTRTTGQSARTLIQERISIEARRLLIFTNLSISEIGYDLGFNDPNYFVRFFKSQNGKSPLKFRKQNQKN